MIKIARGRMIDKVVILSKKVNTISEGAENLYYRLNINADDYGRYHAEPAIIKGQIYTLRKISLKQIENRIQELFKVRLIKLYRNNGEPYLEIVDFEKHQTFKSDRPKKAEFPEPEEYLKHQMEDNGIQMDTNGSLSKDNLTKDKLSKDKISKLSLCLKNISDEDRKLTQLLIDLMLKNDPASSIIRRLTEKRQLEWMDACRKLREIDGRSPQLIERIVRFSQEDDFWHKNILSMTKLREKFDQLFLKAKKEKFAGIKEWLEEMEAKNDEN